MCHNFCLTETWESFAEVDKSKSHQVRNGCSTTFTMQEAHFSSLDFFIS